jgi:hypothetical protein
MVKYLTEQEIDSIIGEIIFDPNFSTMSQDSYNEELIAKKVQQLNVKELCYAAINMSTVGYGNQRYGQYRIGEEIINIQSVFQKYGIKFNNPRSSILKEDDLTANRLCRFFRHKTRKYILNKGIESYLWRKYSPREKAYRHICFRGAEYLEDLKPDEATYLLTTIATMDSKLNTNVAERIIRVFDAKNTKYNIPVK